MRSPLRILHLEADPHDAALVQSTLEAEVITHRIKSNSPIGKIESGVRNWFDQFWRKAPFVGLMLLVASAVGAADAGSPSTNSLADLSLEDLVNLKVTSVSKKEEMLNDAAAAIFVLSKDDLRRSGATR